MRRFSKHILLSILPIEVLSLGETTCAQHLAIVVEDDAAPGTFKRIIKKWQDLALAEANRLNAQ